MLKINFITRPWFFDISLELVRELGLSASVNFILIISRQHYSFLGINEDNIPKNRIATDITGIFSNEIRERIAPYISHVNLICKFEEDKESNLKNSIVWRNLIKRFSILKTDLNIIESLSIADLYLLFRLRNLKNYHIIHDPVLHSGEKRLRLDLLRKISFPIFDRFLVYSKYAEGLFLSNFSNYKDKVLALRTPIYYYQRLSKHLNSEKLIVLFFGRISPYKGVDLFYNASAQLAKEFPNIEFVIAGKGIPGYSPSFLDNNPHSNIKIFNRFISTEELDTFLSKSIICVLPYLDATQSGVIMTSYGFEVPVLVSDCPGLLEYCFDESEFSFKNGDLNDLIEKMRNLISSKGLLLGYREKIKAYEMQNISEMNKIKLLKSL